MSSRWSQQDPGSVWSWCLRRVINFVPPQEGSAYLVKNDVSGEQRYVSATEIRPYLRLSRDSHTQRPDEVDQHQQQPPEGPQPSRSRPRRKVRAPTRYGFGRHCNRRPLYQAWRHLDFYQWFFSRRIDIFCMKVVYLTAVKDWVQSMRVHSECLAAECLIQNYQIQRGCMFIQKDFLSSHTYDKQVFLCQTHCHTSF